VSPPAGVPRPVARLLAAADPAWFFSVGIVLTMFSGNWQYFGISVPLDRVVLAMGALALVLRIPLGERWMLRLRLPHYAMAIAVAYAVTSAYVSGTLGQHGADFALLDRFGIVPFAAFLLAPLAFPGRRERMVLAGVLTLAGAYLGITALFETTHLNGLIWPRYILDPSVGIHLGRARGPFAEAGANGMAMWGCAVAATIVLVEARALIARLAAAAVSLLCVAGILFTLTRAVWLGAGVAGLVTLFGMRELRRFAVPVLVAGLTIVVGALVAVPSLSARASAREHDQSPLWDRYNSDQAGLNMVLAKPLVGVGWGRYPYVSDGYYQQSANYPLTTVPAIHNIYISNAAELGLIGFAAWAAALIAGIGGALLSRPPPHLRIWRAALFAIAVEWAVVGGFGPLSYTFANLLLWTWAGVVYGRTAFPIVRRREHAFAVPAPATALG
jgi:putative inorganic carbon (HCO3(-)) transporter